MGRTGRPHAALAVIVVAALGFLTGALSRSANAVQMGTPAGIAVSVDQPLDTPLRDVTRDSYHGIRRALWVISYAADVWGRWAARGFCFVVVALLIGLLDRNLLAAWRREGVRVLRTYVPMMVYVYLRLFFDRRVRLVAKLLLVAGIAYGVRRFDILPDAGIVPGYLEDILLIGVAMRFFLYCSPTAAVDEYAAQAVNFRRRLAAY